MFLPCVAALALFSCLQGQQGEATPKKAVQAQKERPPNIILILADDIGIECLESYGGTSYKTPALDAMASKGMRFTHCYSQPLCTPSRVKLMTGRSNARNYRAFSVLPPRERTFSQELKAAGYKTAIAGKWQLYAAEHYPKRIRGTGILPKDAGFDAYCLWQVERLGRRYWGPSYSVDGKFVTQPLKVYGPDVYVEFLLSFIEKNKARPFLVYYPMALVHNPFLPAPGDGSAEDRRDPKHFASMVRYMDRLVGRIVDHVEKLGLSKQTLILFAGDNGTNRKIRSRMGNRIVRGGKGRTDATGNHVPLLALWPGRIEAGSTCEDLVDFADFFPTLLAVAGRPVPDSRQLDGLSFLPQLVGKNGERHDSLFCYYHPRPLTRKKSRPIRMAFDKHWKLYADGRLFDLQGDPAEKSPLLEDQDDPVRTKARLRLRARLTSMPSRSPWLR